MIGVVPDMPGETGAEAMQALLALYGLCEQPKTVSPRPFAAAIDIWAEPDVCGWPDEGPRDDPARVAAWCAAVCKRNTDIALPPPLAAEVTAGESGADWLHQACRKHGVIPSGHYDAEILPHGMRLISTAKTAGVSLLVGLNGGEHAGAKCRLNFLCEGPDALVRRDLGLLQRWGAALGVGKTRDILDLVARLGRVGKGRRITLGIASRETRNGIELACVSVDVGAPAMAEGFDFVLAKVADKGRSAAKRIVGKSDGSYETFAYDRVTHWLYAPKLVSGHAGMARLLAALATRPDLMLVIGGIRPGLDLSKPQLRRWANPDPGKNTLLDVPRAWVAVDVDGYGVPPAWGLAEHLPDAGRAIRDDALGEDFAGVACVVAATSRTGLAGEDEARLRLFFVLDRPHSLNDLRRWAMGAQAAGFPVDPSIFQPGQPVYTARPRFEGALRDPVPEPLRAFMLPAAVGCGDRVALDVHRYDNRMNEIGARIRQAETWSGGDWRLLLTETLGGPASFFMPLSRGLGLAARSTDSEAEIVGFVSALLAERADPGRQRQYGPRWLASTLKRFRRFDRLSAASVAGLRAAMFEETS